MGVRIGNWKKIGKKGRKLGGDKGENKETEGMKKERNGKGLSWRLELGIGKKFGKREEN